MKILLLHGPNLNLLGKRQPEIYGHETLQDVENKVRGHAFGRAEIECFQSNHEGELIDAIHRARESTDAIIINAGAYTHTSVAILDALNAFEGKVVELHISNVHARESFRHHSYLSARADGIIVGLGTYGYLAAVDFLTS
ncbi:type II 3-dehydroquinate dehydratase [Halotalea alkalilenta]|uniref:3-dehydroquinate dehydratase n=1 Tax=Halotalea alkalilenta TaxID=376489 RepID=A0A172YAR9_9GAMM|nr:type II 3-dehydroquinate dehydratase [Halotalea alkalilenta]ANF56226.1 3-dehydroquinate dehydratase [Halotalea alkalilenta]